MSEAPASKQAETPDRIVLALAVERERNLERGRAANILPIDEQLALRGWCVDTAGQLIKVDERRRAVEVEQPEPERADVEPAPENTAEPKPRRGRPRPPRDDDGKVIRD